MKERDRKKIICKERKRRNEGTDEERMRESIVGDRDRKRDG
jgi:hypothetical protein